MVKGHFSDEGMEFGNNMRVVYTSLVMAILKTRPEQEEEDVHSWQCSSGL